MPLIKVAAHSRPASVGWSIAGTMRDHGHAEVQATGATAVHQAVKGIAFANTCLARDGIEIRCLPRFVDLDISGEDRTGIQFLIEPK